MWLGQSEQRLHASSRPPAARSPCVLFLDEVDALGQKRSHLRHSAGRNVVNQLLAELDGANADNDGVFVLAATNHPWDVDTALRRPGRLDRTVLVLPPDEPARAAILERGLRERPTEGIDAGRSPRGPPASRAPTSCTSSTWPSSTRSPTRSARVARGRSRRRHLERARKEISASTRPWFAIGPQLRAVRQRGRHVRRSARLHPRARPAVNAAEEPSRLQSQAEGLIAVGRHEQALEVLARAAALDPEDARPHVLRAQALLALKRGDEAHEAAAAATARAPESSHAHRLLAIADLARGNDHQGKQDALRAVALDPDEALNFVVLGQALQATRDEAGALAAAHHAVELAPSSATGYALEGRLLLAHDDMPGAERALRRALALDPENDSILNNLALALQRQGRRDEAVAALEAAARIDPTSETVRGNVLRIGRRNVPFVRGLAILVAVIGLIVGVGAALSGELVGIVPGALLLVLGIATYDASIRVAYHGLPRPSGELVRDDYEARRYKPWRWDLSWLLRLRPWWWILLQRVSPPIALLLNIGVVALAVAGGAVVPAVVFGIGVPLSAWRVWRWYRRVHPSAGSWRPPA